MSPPTSPSSSASNALLKLHPSLWRGSQLGSRLGLTLSTGFPTLDAELPGGGWPTGTLIELLTPHAGVGEIKLLHHALQASVNKQPIVLLQPPYQPHIACWSAWQLGTQRLLYITPEHLRDADWAAEQILKNGSCAALLYWAHPVQTSILKRLHLAAQSSQTLFFIFRPLAVQNQPSPAALRIALAPDLSGALTLSIIKRRGPACGHPIKLAVSAYQPLSTPTHDTMDWSTAAQHQPRYLAAPLAD